MSFVQFFRLMLKPWRDCLGFRGRSSAGEAVAFYLLTMLAGLLRLSIDIDFGRFAELGWTLLWSLPSIALMVRRLHDQGRSGRLAWLLALVPLLWALAGLLPQSPTGSLRLTFLGIVFRPAPGPATILLVIATTALLIAMTLMYLLPGERGANRYGPDPRRAPSPAM